MMGKLFWDGGVLGLFSMRAGWRMTAFVVQSYATVYLGWLYATGMGGSLLVIEVGVLGVNNLGGNY